MSGATQSILPRHVKRQRASFVLTSLIDVIFLLVIFFMVSSQIVPFSIIGLGPIAGEAGPTAPAAPSPASTVPIALRVMAGSVRVAGDTVAIGALAPALTKLKGDGVTALLVIPTARASVQDLVSVLEAIKASAIPTVTVINRRGAS